MLASVLKSRPSGWVYENILAEAVEAKESLSSMNTRRYQKRYVRVSAKL
jgi:hypothetical protein